MVGRRAKKEEGAREEGWAMLGMREGQRLQGGGGGEGEGQLGWG